MAVPNPTFESKDISNTGVWTLEGPPTFEMGPFNSGIVLIGDAVDNAAFSNNGFTDSSGSSHSLKCTVNSNNLPIGVNDGVLCQRDADSGAAAIFNLEMGIGGGISCAFFDGTTSNFVASRVSFANDGAYHVVHATVNGDDLNIFIDGVEGTYLGTQDQTAGNGFGGGVNYSGTINLTVAAMSPETTVAARRFHDGNAGGVAIWEGTTLTAAQVLEDFNNQIAGFSARDAEAMLLTFS